MIKVFVFSKLVCSLCHTAAKQIRLDGEIKVYPLFCACGGEIIEKDVNETYETEEKREPLISIEQAL